MVEEMGMTNEQYKGLLLDELEDWHEILKLVIAAGNKEAEEAIRRKIDKINEKLKF